MDTELLKELNKRGSAEVIGEEVCQVTQAVSDTDGEVEYLMFGELKKQSVIPINEACNKCDFWKGKFDSPEQCQSRQTKDAKARGFGKLICPEQLRD